MRPIRLLIPLLAVALALTVALARPLQGRATRTTAPRFSAQPVQRPEPRPRPHPIRRVNAAAVFGHRIVAYARRFLGTPYSYGGSTPRTGFDCSGLVRFVYGHFGIALPHSSWGDLAHGRHIGRHILKAGDLVFFYGASHVGIYVGDGRFIDAPHTGARVRISTMDEYASYYSARRFR
jgi:cell wall-associated NlpC family hydrolase